MRTYLSLLPKLALGAAIIAVTVIALAPTLSLTQPAFADASGVESFAASVPPRAFQTDVATRGVFDNRAAQLQPGYTAALAAVFPSSGDGFDVYRINPATGEGTFYLRITRADINSAFDQVGDTGQNVLIIPADSGFTDEQISNNLPQVFALTTGDCGLLTSFPDGKTASFIFDC